MIQMNVDYYYSILSVMPVVGPLSKTTSIRYLNEHPLPERTSIEIVPLALQLTSTVIKHQQSDANK